MWNDEESREVFSAIQEGGRRATQLLKAYVKEGNVDAMVVLALREKTSAEDTVALLRQAARQGHAYAQLHLGLEYIWGANIRKHRSSGLKLITESADQGCNFAAMWLAEHYLEGDGPERDDKNGIRLLKQVANSQEYQPCIHFKEIEACDSYAEYVQLREGYAIAVAQENLAVMYESGVHGLPKDNEQAVFWLAKLYACGLTDVAWDLVALYKILGNNDQVEPILEALVKRDDPDAMVELARLLEQSPVRNNRTDPYKLRLRARKLAATAAHPSPSSIPVVSLWRSNRLNSPAAKLDEVKNLLDQSPPDYVMAYKLLIESDMWNFQPATPYRQRVINYLAYGRQLQNPAPDEEPE